MYGQIILLNFEILACTVFRITIYVLLLHTHKYYNVTPHLPLKVVVGSIILLSYFLLFDKTNFFRGILFHSVPFGASELALLRNSECLGMSAFFRGITESVPSLFRRIFSERNSVVESRTVHAEFQREFVLLSNFALCGKEL
jgi:hypothetical protein